MRLKLSELNPNPFKKEINKGKLSDEQVKKLMANLDKLKLMGALPCVKREGKFYLVAGHHRVEALKRKFGKDYEVEITLHNYNDDELFRGMIIENLSQRRGEFQETKSNIVAVRDFLNKHKEILNALRDSRKPSKIDKLGRVNLGINQDFKDKATSNDVAKWLDDNSGKVMMHDEITEYLNINDRLDEDLQKITELKHDQTKQERDNPNTINKSQAVLLARIEDKKEQKDLADALKNSQEQRVREQGKLITIYKELSDEVKEQVRSGEMDIKDVAIEKLKEDIQKKIIEQKEKDKGKIVVTHYKQYQRESSNRIGKTNNEIIQTVSFLNGLYNSGVLYELDWKTMLKIVEAGANGGKSYGKFMEKIMEEIK